MLPCFYFVIEFVADKIQVVDSAWDLIHTFIRIPAGAVLAATAFGDFDKSVQVIAFLVGGGLALSSHGTKAATRLLINTSPRARFKHGGQYCGRCAGGCLDFVGCVFADSGFLHYRSWTGSLVLVLTKSYQVFP